jgi:hypothetical protein
VTTSDDEKADSRHKHLVEHLASIQEQQRQTNDHLQVLRFAAVVWMFAGLCWIVWWIWAWLQPNN